MRVEEVDERDSSWEDPRPRFRVYLQGGVRRSRADDQGAGGQCDGDQGDGEEWTGGGTATYDVTGADLLQVVDWAQERAGADMTYAVALVRDDLGREQHPGAGRGLVWLVGMDGNDGTEDDPAGREVQRRMLVRRGDPVGIPAADRAPTGAG